MKKIVISIKNSLLERAISKALVDSGVFNPFCVKADSKNNGTVEQCKILQTQMLLAEVSHSSGCTLSARLVQAAELRRILPSCLIVFLCDENYVPEFSNELMHAKKDGKIDAFFYTSVTHNFLVAALRAL